MFRFLNTSSKAQFSFVFERLFLALVWVKKELALFCGHLAKEYIKEYLEEKIKSSFLIPSDL